jgi:tetratricopeptide (TPR) repeat protein
MSIGSKDPGTVRFVTRALPWLVGAGGLLVYLITLNHWISFYSLGTVMRISGWSWQPQLDQPLTAAVFYPFRFLPATWIPLALNILTAVCAAVVLALLARTVALFPHDLTPPDLLLRNQPPAILSTALAWIPPVFAAVICGLQLSFWEHATSATGEMIDLLILAYVIRCLLEFRVSQDQSWLWRSALIFGAGMANNWVLAGLFPLYLAALLRLKGLAFLNRRFLLRLALCGLAGLSLYLLLPLLHSLRPRDPVDFWMALKANLKSQTVAFTAMRAPSFRLLISLSLFSLLLLSIRWKSQSVTPGPDSRLGVLLNRSAGHFVHALFLAGSLWIALDPILSPRHLGHGVPMLTWYYISALVCGYCSGYLLLLASDKFRPWEAKMALAATLVLFCALPPLLLWRNLGQIRTTNGPAVHEFARQLCEDLPEGRFVLLSDDSTQLFLVRAELSAHRDKEALPLETLTLFLPQYQAFMADQFRSRWPVVSTNRLESVTRSGLVNLIAAFAMQEPVLYLHPSSGLFFEAYAGVPNRFIRRLTVRPAGEVAGSQLTEQAAAANERIWQQRWTNSLQSLAARTSQPTPAQPPTRPLLKFFRLTSRRNSTASTLGAAYSKAANDWGVQLQQLERWPEAGVWFQRALKLNPKNLPARINLEYNERCRRGEKSRLKVGELRNQIPALFADSGDWRQALEVGGPVDEPTFLLRTGRVFLQGGNIRQATASFARSVELAPDWIPPKLWLAECRIGSGDFAGALKLTDDLQAAYQPTNGLALAQLLGCRVIALRGLGRTNEAARCLESFVNQYGEHLEVFLAAGKLYAQSGHFEEELTILDLLLKREPRNAELLANRGLAELRLGQFDHAIATLTTLLSFAPADDESRLHRAAACMAAGQLDAARRDYQQLLGKTGYLQNALFGLGGVAWREHETNTAIQYYHQFLSNSIPGSFQQTMASERLKQLTTRDLNP